MEPLPWLPDYIIYEILSRVAVKSLCRFLCVSKRWHALISDPVFVATHKCPDLLLFTPFFSRSSGKVQVKVTDINNNILRVLDGAGSDVATYWSLHAALDGSPHVNASSDQLVDVATGKVIMACPPELRKKTCFLFTVGCTVAPSCVYKAVHITRRYPHTCMILTLGEEEDAQWRPVPPPPFGASLGYREGSVVAIKGVVHFLPARRTPLLRFDLETETWMESIEGPPVPNLGDLTTSMRISISKFNDTLCMTVSKLQWPDERVKGDCRLRTDVWLLIDQSGGGSWSKAYSMLMDPTSHSIRPLRVMPSNNGPKQLLVFCYVIPRSSDPTPVLRVYDSLGVSVAADTKMRRGIAGVYCLNLKQAISDSSFLPRGEQGAPSDV